MINFPTRVAVLLSVVVALLTTTAFARSVRNQFTVVNNTNYTLTAQGDDDKEFVNIPPNSTVTDLFIHENSVGNFERGGRKHTRFLVLSYGPGSKHTCVLRVKFTGLNVGFGGHAGHLSHKVTKNNLGIGKCAANNESKYDPMSESYKNVVYKLTVD